MSNAPNADARKKNILFGVHWIICISLMLFFRYLPGVGGITPYGMQIFGIFLGLLWGWMFIDFLNPSLAAMLVTILTVPDVTWATLCAQGFGNQNIFMMIVVLAISEYFDGSGLNQYLANWFVSRKINIGHPWIFCGILMFASFFFSAFANIIAAMILMWSIVYRTADTVGIPAKSKWITFMVVGITMTASYGCIAVPWQVMGLIFLSTMKDAVGVTGNIGTWCIVFIIFTIASVVLYLAFGRFILKLDVSKIENKDDAYAVYRSTKMNKEQKQAGIILVIFVILLMAPNFLPATLPLIPQLTTLSAVGVAALMLIGVHLLRDKETGTNQYDTTSLMKKSTQWNLIIMCSMCFPLINMMETPEAGVTDAAVNLVMPIVNGMGFIPTVVLIAVILGLLTQFLHNMVLGLIFIPVFAQIAINLGGSPVVMTIAISAALMTSFGTPAASTQSALMFGNTAYCEKGDLFKMAFSSVFVGLICMAIVMIPIASIIL